MERGSTWAVLPTASAPLLQDKIRLAPEDLC